MSVVTDYEWAVYKRRFGKFYPDYNEDTLRRQLYTQTKELCLTNNVEFVPNDYSDYTEQEFFERMDLLQVFEWIQQERNGAPIHSRRNTISNSDPSRSIPSIVNPVSRESGNVLQSLLMQPLHVRLASNSMPDVSRASNNMPSGSQASSNIPSGSRASSNIPSGSRASSNMPSVSHASRNMPSVSQASRNMPSGSQASRNMPSVSQAGSNMPSGSQASSNVPSNNPPCKPESYRIAMQRGQMYRSPVKRRAVSPPKINPSAFADHPTAMYIREVNIPAISTATATQTGRSRVMGSQGSEVGPSTIIPAANITDDHNMPFSCQTGWTATTRRQSVSNMPSSSKPCGSNAPAVKRSALNPDTVKRVALSHAREGYLATVNPVPVNAFSCMPISSSNLSADQPVTSYAAIVEAGTVNPGGNRTDGGGEDRSPPKVSPPAFADNPTAVYIREVNTPAISTATETGRSQVMWSQGSWNMPAEPNPVINPEEDEDQTQQQENQQLNRKYCSIKPWNR